MPPTQQSNAIDATAPPCTEISIRIPQKAGNLPRPTQKSFCHRRSHRAVCCGGHRCAVALNGKPAPNGVLLSSGFASYTANAVATTTNTAAEEAAAGLVAQRLTPDALNSVDSFAAAPGTFSLIEGEDSTPLSEEQQESLAAATQNIEDGGYTVGFTLINLNTGKGIAYNLDSRVYGASSFKGSLRRLPVPTSGRQRRFLPIRQ